MATQEAFAQVRKLGVAYSSINSELRLFTVIFTLYSNLTDYSKTNILHARCRDSFHYQIVKNADSIRIFVLARAYWTLRTSS
jgi:hypothetical protein